MRRFKSWLRLDEESLDAARLETVKNADSSLAAANTLSAVVLSGSIIFTILGGFVVPRVIAPAVYITDLLYLFTFCIGMLIVITLLLTQALLIHKVCQALAMSKDDRADDYYEKNRLTMIISYSIAALCSVALLIMALYADNLVGKYFETPREARVIEI